MSDRERTGILKKFDERLWTLYGKPDGIVEGLFRAHIVGPIRPVKMRPSYTVTDGGQRAGDNDNDDAEEVILTVRIAMHVCDQWEKQATIEEWTNRVETIKDYLRGRCEGFGVLKIKPIGDEHLDVVFLSGATQGDWICDFEVRYFKEVDEYQEW